MGATGISEIRQYLTFRLDEEVFGLDVGKVREILDMTTITKIPRTPEFMRGVINLRGNVVPVVDMRLKFGLPAVENTVDTCIVVTEVALEGETTVLGALVDSVQEVFELEPGQIEPAPRIGTRLRTEFILGMGNAIVVGLDITCIVQERTDESEKDRVTVDGAACLDGPVDEPGHGEKGVGRVLQIVIPGIAFGVPRIPSSEETLNIGEDLVESVQVVFFHDSGERPADFSEHQFRFPRIYDLCKNRSPVGHDRALSLSFFPTRRKINLQIITLFHVGDEGGPFTSSCADE